jgi:hypothetical protein
VLLVADVLLFSWTFRWLWAALETSGERRGVQALRGFSALVAESIVFVLVCAGLAIVHDPAMWFLAGASVVLLAAFAAVVFNVRSEAWYRRYQRGRVDGGLPPRAWWDWRTD